VKFVPFRLSDPEVGYRRPMGLLHHTEHDEPLEPVTHDDALADHAMGIELQLLELAVRRDRAEAQNDWARVRHIDAETEDLEAELGEVGSHLGAA
jgi:hypothetical protein